MIYPALLAGVGLASIVLLLTFVVPRFASIFSDSTHEDPDAHQIMLEASNVVTAWWWVGALAIVVTLIAWRVYTRTVAGRLWWDGARLKLPLLGDALLKAETAAFRARHGNPGGQLRAAGAIDRDRRRYAEQQDHLRRAWLASRMGVKRGEGIAGPMRKAGVFPPLAAHLLTVGEETGRPRPDVRPHGGNLRNRYARFHPALHRDLRAGGHPGDGRADRRADSEYAARDYEHQRRGDIIMAQTMKRNRKRPGRPASP